MKLKIELNEESYLLLQKIDGKTTWEEIYSYLLQKYNSSNYISQSIENLKESLIKEKFLLHK